MANFSISDSPALQRAALPRNSSALSSRDWEEFGNALLEDGLTLTALELYTELLEADREVQCLKDYFSNPGNFEHTIPQGPASTGLLHSIIRTSSLSTFDSIELGRYSDDLEKEHDDKVAVLEFELRKAYDTIKSLRGSLTEATDILPTKSAGPANIKAKVKSDEPIKHHEKRALNFLAHEYLMQQNLMLSAITLTEENGDQNFDDWDDVGLNIPKPPALLQLFRNYSAAVLSDKERLERIQDLEDQLSTATKQYLALKRENEAIQIRLKKRPSVTSIKSNSEKLHRRGSSLGNHQELIVLQNNTKHLPLNCSSPELDPSEVAKQNSDRDIQLNGRASSEDMKGLSQETISKSSRTESSAAQGDAVGAEDENKAKDDIVFLDNSVIEELDEVTTPPYKSPLPRPFSERTQSLNSADESVLNTSREDRASTMLSDMSGSCSTLQNERPDGEIESSTEQTRRQHQQMSVSFRQELLSVSQVKTESRIGLEVAKLTESNFDLVQLMARSLPHIVPIVPLTKREELIPILLGVLSQQSDSKVREQLLHMMFNLIKKPDKAQRQIIMSSCIAFAKISGTSKVESELLPQMWEQITHKHYERRLLVADSCGVLAPYIPPELRGSLVLSMLKQMLSEDKAESVRQAIVRSLGVIVAFIDDEEKFKQCWELVLHALNDPSQLVVTSTYSVLLPALAAWAFELGTLESDLVSYFLHQLLTCIKQVSRTDGESGAVEQSQHHLLTLTHIVPWHYATILQTGPYCDGNLEVSAAVKGKVSFPKPLSPLLDIHVIVGDDDRLGDMVAGFEKEVQSKSFAPWKSLEWFQNDFLNKITRVTVALGFSQPQLIHSLSTLLSAYCTYLGHTYVHKHIKPYYERCLKLPKSNPGAALAEGKTQLTTPVLPVYVAGVLGCFVQDEDILEAYVTGVIIDMATNFSPLDSLKTMVSELCRERRRHTSLLQALQKLSEHSSFQVRRYVAILLGVMVRRLEEKAILKGMLPLLIKLSRDSEISVKVDIIESFGTIMETVTSKDVLIRVHEQFEAFMGVDLFQMDHHMIMAILKTLAKIGPRADPVFRDEFIIPKLADVATMNNISQNTTKRKDIALTLLDAFSNMSECFLSAELLGTYVVPSLEYLIRDFDDLLPNKSPLVEQLMSNFNTKLQDYKKQEITTEQSDGRTGAFFKKFRPSLEKSDLSIATSKFFKKKN